MLYYMEISYYKMKHIRQVCTGRRVLTPVPNNLCFVYGIIVLGSPQSYIPSNILLHFLSCIDAVGRFEMFVLIKGFLILSHVWLIALFEFILFMRNICRWVVIRAEILFRCLYFVMEMDLSHTELFPEFDSSFSELMWKIGDSMNH